MKRKETLYAVIGGCVGAVLTLLVSSFSPLGAQNKSDGSFGKITCAELEVVRPDGTRGVWIMGGRDGGFVRVLNRDGESKASMVVSEEVGFVFVHGKDGKSGAVMSVDKDDGFVSVSGKEGESASMSVHKDGGVVRVSDKDGALASMNSACLTKTEHWLV